MAISDTSNGNSRHVLTDWRPEDPQFWAEKGKAIATRNLWISIPNLLMAFFGLDGVVGRRGQDASHRL